MSKPKGPGLRAAAETVLNSSNSMNRPRCLMMGSTERDHVPIERMRENNDFDVVHLVVLINTDPRGNPFDAVGDQAMRITFTGSGGTAEYLVQALEEFATMVAAGKVGAS